MKKIPTLYERDTNGFVYNLITTPIGAKVISGECIPTRKYDGTCILIDKDHSVWARREVKPGKEEPPNFRPITTDPNTHKIMGWEPIDQTGWKSFLPDYSGKLSPGTYELCGPKVNGNPEQFTTHVLIPHGDYVTELPELTFDGLCHTLIHNRELCGWEGIVWWLNGEPVCKLKAKDFG